MKTSKFSEAQIAFVLKQAEDGTPVAEVCRKAGIAEATFYNWRKRYGELELSDLSSKARRCRHRSICRMRPKAARYSAQAIGNRTRGYSQQPSQSWGCGGCSRPIT